jgi:hypothetical protein
MKQFLWAYVNPLSVTHNKWIPASLAMARAVQWSPWYGWTLQIHTSAFVADRDDLLFNTYGQWNEFLLDRDESIAQDIHVHLQSIGKYVKAMDLVNFLDKPEMHKWAHLEKWISLATAQQWMKKLDYCWTMDPKGQFVDGHEREDIVTYRQNKFLPAWRDLKDKTQDWSNGGQLHLHTPDTHPTVLWIHDESTFYVNDH